ncbi:MAG TPA: class I SAM-dependent methyltransferase [Conexibacter sp.]|nr:class I SAM-dependent methyltransferase [Conexibacter sp.]
MPEVTNVCAGPFGAFYDFYIERPWLAGVIGHVVWGVELAPLYASMAAIGDLRDGATILDVPCGGGVALRGLRPGQRARWVAVDVDRPMLERFDRRAAAREGDGLGVELVQADMRELPLADASADLCLAYSGLHMVTEPAAAVAELVRCLKPGGALVGSTFLAEGSHRQRFLLGQGERSGGNGALGTSRELRAWLQDGGLAEVTIERDRGFTVFRGRRPA